MRVVWLRVSIRVSMKSERLILHSSVWANPNTAEPTEEQPNRPCPTPTSSADLREHFSLSIPSSPPSRAANLPSPSPRLCPAGPLLQLRRREAAADPAPAAPRGSHINNPRREQRAPVARHCSSPAAARASPDRSVTLPCLSHANSTRRLAAQFGMPRAD